MDLFEAVIKLFQKKEGSPSDLPLLERRVAHLEQALKLMDIDLQDAIDGFYRRRQSDRMKEIREEEAAKKPKRLTDRDILLRAVEKSSSSDTKE